jgi:6-phosphogluconolactonase
MPHLSVFATRDALMQAAADRLEAALRDGIAARGAACIALSGGSTPEPAYAALAARALDWANISFILVDERFVAPDEDASNEKMLRRALAPALAKGARLLPLFSAGSLADAAARADAIYAPLQIDAALMGMGGDMHTASWFPGAAHDALTSTRSVVAAHADGAAGSAARLTLTRDAIGRAHRVLLLISGEDKRAALDAAFGLSAEDAPVAALFSDCERQPEVLWAA